jgi:hypothetical protein
MREKIRASERKEKVKTICIQFRRIRNELKKKIVQETRKFFLQLQAFLSGFDLVLYA